MSDVIKLFYPQEEIALVTMEDRAHHNTFSKELIQGLTETFAAIHLNPKAKVVIVQGYDNYFCSGGTKEDLFNILEGRMVFTDLSIFRIFLDCELPVIAALQGDAMGGGFAFPCYADLLILGEECFYTASFMKYGFTPGMGATYILPQKIGPVLGREMLYTARNYQGRELKARGALPLIVKRAEVLSAAMSLAGEIADKPLLSLKLLKKQLTQELREKLPTVIEQELRMHQQTFAQEEVRLRIEALFGK